MSNKISKVDLTILKKLVEQLEIELAAAEEIKKNENSVLSDYVVGMSKAAGLAAGIMQEGSLLVGDIQSVVRTSQQVPSKNSDFLEKLLGGIKGDGTAN